MNNLNKAWSILIIAGVVFLIGFVLYSLWQSSVKTGFNEVINNFDTNQLINQLVENHLRSDPNFLE